METTLLDRAVAAVTTPVQQAADAASELAAQARDLKAGASDAAEEYRRAIARNRSGVAPRRLRTPGVGLPHPAGALRRGRHRRAAGFAGGAATAWALMRAGGGDKPATKSPPR